MKPARVQIVGLPPCLPQRWIVFASGFICPGCGRENRHIVVELKGPWLRLMCPECEASWAERVERLDLERKKQT